MRLQTQPLHPVPHYNGAFDCFQKVLVTDGALGLFRGVSMPLLGATVENATLFTTYNQCQRALRYICGSAVDSNRPLPFSMLGIAAAVSGAATGFVLTPLELIKCKMQVQTMAGIRQRSPAAFVAKILREEGIRGLWVGITGTLLRETGGGIAWFLTFEACTKKLVAMHKQRDPSFEHKNLGALELMTSGAAAGIMYNASLFPVRAH